MKDEEKKEVIEEKEIKEMQEEIKIKKNRDLKSNSGLGSKIFNIAFWVIIIGLFTVWIIDFTMVKMEKKPVFCISKKTHTYDDGTVESCTGLGYKIYEYKLENKNAIEFGPFFVKMDME